MNALINVFRVLVVILYSVVDKRAIKFHVTDLWLTIQIFKYLDNYCTNYNSKNIEKTGLSGRYWGGKYWELLTLKMVNTGNAHLETLD